jgi:hypothetical protein
MSRDRICISALLEARSDVRTVVALFELTRPRHDSSTSASLVCANARPADAAALLDQLAKAILSLPEIMLVEVTGHADAATDFEPLAMSQARAEAVVAELVSRGVPASRVRARGYGALCRLGTADGPSATARERFVEFRIAKRFTGPGEPLGCPLATANGVVAAPVP